MFEGPRLVVRYEDIALGVRMHLLVVSIYAYVCVCVSVCVCVFVCV